MQGWRKALSQVRECTVGGDVMPGASLPTPAEHATRGLLLDSAAAVGKWEGAAE